MTVGYRSIAGARAGAPAPLTHIWITVVEDVSRACSTSGIVGPLEDTVTQCTDVVIGYDVIGDN